MADLTLGLSFDDVLLVPKKSEVLPTEALLGTPIVALVALVIERSIVSFPSKIRSSISYREDLTARYASDFLKIQT